MKYLGYIFFAIAVVFFVSDMITVTFLKDLIPLVDDRWKSTISLISLTIGISLYKISKMKSQN